MKKFTKLFLSCAIVSAVAAATASMAMAADLDATYSISGDFTGTYTAASNDITSIAGVTPDPDTEVTFLVYKQGADAATVAAADVIGIDQNKSGAAGSVTAQPKNNGLKADSVTAPDDGQNTYVVKIGYYTNNEFKVATAKFVTGTAVGSEQWVGDIDDNHIFNVADSVAVLKHLGNVTWLHDDALQAADCDDNAIVNIADNVVQLKHIGKVDTTKLGENYKVADKTRTVTDAHPVTE